MPVKISPKGSIPEPEKQSLAERSKIRIQAIQEKRREETSSSPTDGEEVAPDSKRKPTDQQEDYEIAGISLPSGVHCSLGCDVYDGPNGHGYVAFALIRLGRRIWRRDVNVVGKEEWRTRDWQDVTPKEI